MFDFACDCAPVTAAPDRTAQNREIQGLLFGFECLSKQRMA